MSEQDRPLGNYAQADYDFFSLAMDVLEWEPTAEELEERKKAEEEMNRLVNKEEEFEEIVRRMRDKNLRIRRDEGGTEYRRFDLFLEKVDLALLQGDRKTTVIIPALQDIDLTASNLYEIFFDKIPFCIYGESAFSPSPQDIQNSTTARIRSFGYKQTNLFELKSPQEKTAFEKRLVDDIANISAVDLDVANAEKPINFGFTLPNPKNSELFQSIKFRFPSRDAFSDKTMFFLLGMHKRAQDMKGREAEFAALFTEGVNLVKDLYRVR